MRYPYGEPLGVDAVLQLAMDAAAQLDIHLTDIPQLRMKISKREPVPLMLKRHATTLWIDRYYIACSIDDAEIQYLYLTRQHIIEERIAALRQRRQRGYGIPVQPPIQQQFSAAWRAMNRTGKAYALRPFSRPQGEAARLDLKAPPCLSRAGPGLPDARPGSAPGAAPL